MGLFGPAKEFNPLAQQMALGMWQRGMQMQPQTPLQLVTAMAQMLGGGLMARKQNLARGKAEEETMGAIQAARGMQPNQEMVAPPQEMLNSPLQYVPPQLKQEPQAQFLQRQQQAVMDALLKSDIPEYRDAGKEMMLKSFTMSAPEFQFINTGDTVLAANPQNGQVFPVFQEDKPLKIEQRDPGKDLLIIDPNTNMPVQVIPGTPKAPEYRETIGPDGKPRYEDFDPASQQWVPSSQAPEKKGQTINVNTGVPGELPELTTGAKTDFQTKKLEAESNLVQLDKMITEFDPTMLQAPEKAKQFFRTAKAWAGVKLSDEEIERGLDVAEYRARIQKFAVLEIKRITGAQMSEREADRLLTAIPTASDDPITFAGKLLYTYEATKDAITAYDTTLRQLESRGVDAVEADRQAKAAADAIVRTRIAGIENFTKDDWEVFARQKEIQDQRNPSTESGEVAAGVTLE